MNYVIFKKFKSQTGEHELYATRALAGFTNALSPRTTNLTFGTAREAYKFAGEFPVLQNWKVGFR